MGFPRNDFITEAKKLGHSNKFIEETLKYAANLDEKKLPVIFDQQHLAYMLLKKPHDLKQFILEVPGHYKYFAIKKRSGGLRRIMSPYQDLREIQTWIKENILDNIELPKYVTAFAKGRSTLENAKIHEQKKYILKVDITDFFESIDVRRVYKAFCRIGYEKGVSAWLASLCTSKLDEYKYERLEEQKEIQKLFEELLLKEEPFLIQGSPTSPALANIICYKMDRRMMGLANKYGCCYSRYADDMTFSADDVKSLPKVGMIRRIVKSEGFCLKEEKTALLHKGNRQIVTGLLVDGRVRVPGKYKKDIKRHIHFCLKYGGREHFHRISPYRAYGKEWLEGRIRYVYSIEPDAAKKLWADFKRIDWGY